MAVLLKSLSTGDIIPLGFSLLVTWYFVSSVIAWYRLRHIPGPFLSKFSYLWLAKTAHGARQYYVHRDLCRKYGPLVRVGPNELTTDDPEVLRRMGAVRGTYGKDPWYIGSRFDPYHDNVITILDIAKHDKFKAQLGGEFGGREIPLLEVGVDEQIKTLIDMIRLRHISDEKSDDSNLVDLAPLMSYLTMDVITKVAFGKEYGYLKANADLYDFLQGVRDNWPKLAMAVDVPWYRNVIMSPWFLKLFGPSVKDTKGMGKLMGVARETVSERYGPEAKAQRDLLGTWIRNDLSQIDAEVGGLFLVIAGSDTTASAIRITMLHLMTSPRVYNKLKKEITRAIQEDQVSTPITFEQAKRLSYLQAVIYEGLRIRPPAPGLYPKAVPAGGDMIHGKFIPAGTAIGMNTASLFSSPRHFGTDVDTFRPERFADAVPERRTEMERLVELAFGNGRYQCAGKSVAFMELNKVFFELHRNFDFQLANPTNPWKSRSYSLFIEEDLWVKITEAMKADEGS